MDSPDSNESITVGLKILGAILAFLSLRWLINIFKGKDGRLDQDEFKKMVALLLFVGAFIYIIYSQGTRTDLSQDVFGPVWLATITGGVLSVLHMDKALESITKLVEAFVKLRAGAANSIQVTSEVTAGVQGNP